MGASVTLERALFSHSREDKLRGRPQAPDVCSSLRRGSRPAKNLRRDQLVGKTHEQAPRKYREQRLEAGEPAGGGAASERPLVLPGRAHARRDRRGARHGARRREDRHKARIVKLTDNTFFAQAVLTNGTAVDARPSDALTLAALAGCPIYVAGDVLDRADERRPGLSDRLKRPGGPGRRDRARGRSQGAYSRGQITSPKARLIASGSGTTSRPRFRGGATEPG